MVPLKITFTGLMLGVVAALVIGSAEAHDPDHHEQLEWYQSLMQPDAPNSSCCGEADAYWVEGVHCRCGTTYAVMTDDRPAEMSSLPHVAAGTEVDVPISKRKW